MYTYKKEKTRTFTTGISALDQCANGEDRPQHAFLIFRPVFKPVFMLFVFGRNRFDGRFSRRVIDLKFNLR